MMQQKIKATDLERQYIANRIDQANAAEALAKEVFTMFCEGHAIPGATFVGIEGDCVIVVVATADGNEAKPDKPELVKEA